MAEGEKAMAEAKASFDNPLAEPESAPQIAAEPQPALESALGDARRVRRKPPRRRCRVAAETALSEAPAPVVSAEEKPAKAVAAG